MITVINQLLYQPHTVTSSLHVDRQVVKKLGYAQKLLVFHGKITLIFYICMC